MSFIFSVLINALVLIIVQYNIHAREFSPTQTDMIFGDYSKRAVAGPSNTADLTFSKHERDSSPFQNLRKPLTCPFYGNYILIIFVFC